MFLLYWRFEFGMIMNPLLKVAIDAARAGSKVLLQSMDRIDRIEITEKGPLDFVSAVDHQAEFAIIELLKKYYPDYSVCAEESGFEEGNDAEYCWLIDPLDGTSNYLKGIPHFAISIALLKNDQPIHGVVYDPVRDELFTASKGHGAFCNNNRLRVQNIKKSVKGSYLALGGPSQRNQKTWFNQLEMMNLMVQRVAGFRRMGAASLDLCYVAAGRVDGYWGTTLKPWDFRAAELIIKEAGGFVTDFQGEATFVDSGDIIAASPKLLHDLISLFNDHCKIDQNA